MSIDKAPTNVFCVKALQPTVLLSYGSPFRLGAIQLCKAISRYVKWSLATLLKLQLLGGIALTLSIGCGFLWASLSLLKQHYVVSLEGIYVSRLFGSRFIRWDEVEILNVIPTYAGADNIKLFLHAGKSATLYIAFLAHQARSARTIIEAAHFGNSEITVNFALGNDYGPPPYGIFYREEIALRAKRGTS